MLNTTSLDTVAAARFGAHFRRPALDSYSFAGLPALIRHALTGEGAPGLPADVLGDLPRRYDRAALLFLDAFGWAQVERWLDRSPLLQRGLSEGVLSQLTSQFPSTTTVHITTICYNQPVGQHGLYEWNLYEPQLDRLIVPLHYRFAEEEGVNTLPLDPQAAAPGPSFFSQLAGQGVRSFVAEKRDYFGTRSAQVAFAGADWLPFAALEDGLDQLASAFEGASGPAYGFLYWDDIDAASHEHGPDSPETAAQVQHALAQIEERFVRRLAASGDGRTLLLITADHGQMAVNPEGTIYINDHLPALEGLIRRGAGGRLLAPAGSSRDLFLHVAPEYIDEVAGLLRAHPALAGRGEVHTTRALADAGLFGATSAAFWRRVGDIVVLPYAGQMVWWRDPANPHSAQHFRGHHGGLSSAEMDIPLLALAF
jgi:predicted AlkP superfamily pyrophosphatase or phosphodiesterase